MAAKCNRLAMERVVFAQLKPTKWQVLHALVRPTRTNVMMMPMINVMTTVFAKMHSSCLPLAVASLPTQRDARTNKNVLAAVVLAQPKPTCLKIQPVSVPRMAVNVMTMAMTSAMPTVIAKMHS